LLMSPNHRLSPSACHFERIAGSRSSTMRQLGTVKVQMASTPLDYLVVAFVSCDFQSLLCKRFDFRHKVFPADVPKLFLQDAF
jgi:hypothetical protein